MPLDQSGQLDGQLIQIGDVQERITVLDTVVSHVLFSSLYFFCLPVFFTGSVLIIAENWYIASYEKCYFTISILYI